MCLVPDRIAGESPGSSYSDEEIPLCFPQHESDGDEQHAHERQHCGAHLEVCKSEAPSQSQPVDVKHESDNQHDEEIEYLAKLCDVRLEWINIWDNDEENQHSQSDEGHQEHAPEFGCIAIHLVVHIPVRCHLIGKLIP